MSFDSKNLSSFFRDSNKPKPSSPSNSEAATSHRLAEGTRRSAQPKLVGIPSGSESTVGKNQKPEEGRSNPKGKGPVSARCQFPLVAKLLPLNLLGEGESEKEGTGDCEWPARWSAASATRSR